MSETVRRASAGFSTISWGRSPRRIQPQLFHVRELSGQCAGHLCLLKENNSSDFLCLSHR
ncbi:hypothetical protein CDEST_04875 [Colletotrichum destructivum]|uniref:Uncharacterized protein n=1 Tax=Colletotrichum destructivum TaxID=34406 RepID=A0AAX4I9K5_9PEZI|nr:hypothetical protein CDEST_04875 [Colletotrichum destructivum]